MSAFRLTEQYSNELLGLSGLPLLQAVEAIVNKHRTKPPRWIPVTERRPTAEDGMKGSTWAADGVAVLWMMPKTGTVWGVWDDPPTGAIAWLRIPDYVPPVPTPEDKERLAFEKWAIVELGDIERYSNGPKCNPHGPYVSENVQCAWAAWQAAREGEAPNPGLLGALRKAEESLGETNEILINRLAEGEPLMSWQSEVQAALDAVRQAARADAGTPEQAEPPIDPRPCRAVRHYLSMQEKSAWEEFSEWHKSVWGCPANSYGDDATLFGAFKAGKAKGGAQ